MLSTTFGSRLGEFAALATAIFWTVTVLCFEFAGKRVGTLSLNLIRLSLGFLFLSLFSWITRGRILPFDASPTLWFWLAASGLVGFVLGDILLFQAFIEIGGRISMLIYSAVPPLSALLGWVFLGERINLQGFIGMGITLTGIALVILERNSVERPDTLPNDAGRGGSRRILNRRRGNQKRSNQRRGAHRKSNPISFP
jgi:drug/metabolite transporter (DMT)-like permease